MDTPAFGLHIERVDGWIVAELWGEVDLVAVERLAVPLAMVAQEPSLGVIVDLRRVTFMDCCGLSLLCLMRNGALEQGRRLTLVIESPSLHRLLRLAGLADVFEIAGSLQAALGRYANGAEGGQGLSA
ncbi:STAS domain-containing protein [Streptomyces sp. NBC_01304]|uniref:STAS domain-containing protein n=1 Tax=Streptomyces sp. NBC_01304 TaxID=2903818 RepID=UPI002E15BE6C|nr:STAS domain-containing protein [Streptomyces sp. NBC_01304]